jgi:hypothetical protein
MSREADSCPQLGEALIGQLKGGEHFFTVLAKCSVMRQRLDDNSCPNDKTNQTQFPEWKLIGSWGFGVPYVDLFIHLIQSSLSQYLLQVRASPSNIDQKLCPRSRESNCKLYKSCSSTLRLSHAQRIHPEGESVTLKRNRHGKNKRQIIVLLHSTLTQTPMLP